MIDAIAQTQPDGSGFLILGAVLLILWIAYISG